MANVKSLLKAKNPVSGEETNLLDWKSWIKYFLGVVMILIVFGGGIWLYRKFKSKVGMSETPSTNFSDIIKGGE